MTLNKTELELKKALADFKNVMLVLAKAESLAPNIQTEISMYTAMCEVFTTRIAYIEKL